MFGLLSNRVGALGQTRVRISNVNFKDFFLILLFK